MMTMTDVVTPAPIPGERTLLIVEDDKSFLTRLARAMEQRGFAVSTAETVADGLLQVEKAPPHLATDFGQARAEVVFLILRSEAGGRASRRMAASSERATILRGSRSLSSGWPKRAGPVGSHLRMRSRAIA